jgi:hypothetical protein
LNVQGVKDVTQTEMDTAESSVPVGTFDFNVATVELERYKSLGAYQLLAELIHAGRNVKF